MTKGSKMSAEGPSSSYEKWELTERMELEKEEQKGRPRGVLSSLTSPPHKAIALLYVLLALTLVLFTALTAVNLRRASAAWEELEEAQLRTQEVHAAAWRNLSELHRALDQQLSHRLKVLRSQLLNESQDLLKPLLQQLEETKQKQNQSSESLQAALEAVHNLSGILCTRCPPGWQQFARTCYYFSTSTSPWPQARDSCAQAAAHLVIVDSEQENKFVANQLMEDKAFWLGLSDLHHEGRWQWLDGSSLALSFWGRGEPNDAGHQGEDCASILPRGSWNDLPCAQSQAWACERPC